MKKVYFLPFLLLLLAVIVFFKPFFAQGKHPIPSDTIIGLYHPFRDLYAQDYPNGIPYKNFLVTDPVRQQYPWRVLSLDTIKQGNVPLWNPYAMAGTPLLANFQSAALYPLNILLFIFPYSLGWSLLIFLQPILAGIFLYLYLDNLRLRRFASFLGAISFTFSGFLIAWLEWGTIGHTALWLPLLLLAIDKIFYYAKKQKITTVQSLVANKAFRWGMLFTFSMTAALFAGHVQTFFYLALVTSAYFVARWIQYGKAFTLLLLFLFFAASFLLITGIQWLSTVQFIELSARSIDQVDWQKPGWFIPWQHVIQFVAPDFFGNPTTLNYWGEWNYGEFVGYVGIVPLIMALFALVFRKDKKTLFYTILFFLSLIFAFPTIFAQLPYMLNIPFLGTTQPTRLLFITDFALAVLAALGLDFLLKTQKKFKIVFVLAGIGAIFLGLWSYVLFGASLTPSILAEYIAVAKRNLYIPTFFFITSAIIILLWAFDITHKKLDRVLNRQLLSVLLLIFLLTLSAFDQIRFAEKFTPFSDQRYLFPSTKAIDFLQKQPGQFRIMATDSRILPPNFSVMYGLQSLDGYDPLYLLRYGELITAINRKNGDITPPFGFNRIITPQQVDSRYIDLLGVQYVLSLSDIQSPKLEKVFVEGQTQIYKNKQAFPRAFFVETIKPATDKNQAISLLFNHEFDLKKTAVVEGRDASGNNAFASGSAEIIFYEANKVVIKTTNSKNGFLVLMDSYYPTWKAKVCNENKDQCSNVKIYQTNYHFRGIEVPGGNKHIVFYNSLL